MLLPEPPRMVPSATNARQDCVFPNNCQGDGWKLSAFNLIFTVTVFWVMCVSIVKHLHAFRTVAYCWKGFVKEYVNALIPSSVSLVNVRHISKRGVLSLFAVTCGNSFYIAEAVGLFLSWVSDFCKNTEAFHIRSL